MFIRMKTTELSQFEKQLETSKQAIEELEATYEKLRGDVKDYDELLPDTELEQICKFIERISKLYSGLSENRKKIKEMNVSLNTLKVRIGDVDLQQACKEFVENNESLKKRLTDLNTKARLLEGNCKEFEGYASDKEQKSVITATKMQLNSFLKTVSVQQTKEVEKRLDKLGVIKRDYANALNKEVLRKAGLQEIAEIEKRLQRQEENVEQSWYSLAKKCQHFQSFDLSFKWQKRHKLRIETATMAAQIKDEVSVLSMKIIEKLDANIDTEDR